jgi:2'-5' RNA ligase
MPRLFTAIELPDGVREILSSVEEPLGGAKWVEDDDLHITLRFAGDIDNRTADEFAGALAEIDQEPFALRVEGVGAFGGNDPRTLYAGLAPCPQLEALARAVERAARNAGLEAEGRKFKPHVTLARLRHARAGEVAHVLQRHAGLRSEPFAVTRFVLLSSRPKVGGGPYVEEAAYPLGRYADFSFTEP